MGAFAKWVLWSCGVLGVLIAVAIGGYRTYRWAYRTPQLALQEVTFQGLQRAQPADLLRLAGVSAGQNLLGLHPAAIERAMAAHPWVDEAHAARLFPHHLSVTVKEHQPAALVALGDLYLVDREGRPFKKLESEDPIDFPLITGLSREQFVESAESSRRRLRQVPELSSAYAQSEPGPAAPLAEIRIGRTGVALVAADEGDAPGLALDPVAGVGSVHPPREQHPGGGDG